MLVPMARHLGLWLALVSLLGCASGSARVTGGGEPDELAAAMRTAAQYRSANYKLSPGDLISVSIYPDERLNRKARVDADGALSLPLVGTATVSGATLLEAQKTIEEKLSSYLVNPHVALIVEEYGNRSMFVLGEVQKPGAYPVPAGSRLTVLQAISAAGGFTKVAAPRRARVMRTVNGKSVDQVIDLKSVSGGEAGTDIVLEPNDVVYVPQSFF